MTEINFSEKCTLSLKKRMCMYVTIIWFRELSFSITVFLALSYSMQDHSYSPMQDFLSFIWRLINVSAQYFLPFWCMCMSDSLFLTFIGNIAKVSLSAVYVPLCVWEFCCGYSSSLLYSHPCGKFSLCNQCESLTVELFFFWRWGWDAVWSRVYGRQVPLP